MEPDLRSLILNNALNEVRNVCPGVQHTFVFKQGNQVLAKDRDITASAINSTNCTFDALIKKANPIGEIESVTFQGADGRVTLSSVNDFYLASVVSNEVDPKIEALMARVLVPTVLNLMQGIGSSSKNSEGSAVTQAPFSLSRVDALAATVYELTVENLRGFRGFLSNSDIVRLDSLLIVQWNVLYGNQTVQEVTIENVAKGKSIRCSFQPIKEPKLKGKNLIQLSEKIQQHLQITKGDQVIVKHVSGSLQNSPVAKQNELDVSPENSDLNLSEVPHKHAVTLPDAIFSQFMVENLGGFLGAPDLVRVDSAVIGRWKEMYETEIIEEVTVEDTVTGKQSRCKFKPIKDSKYDGKGVIQLSEKIQRELQTKKGALVKVKPIVGTE